MSEQIDLPELDPQEVEIAILRDLQEQMRRDFEMIMGGGYPPGYDRNAGMPGMLKLAESRCPHCGPVLACWRHGSV